MFAKGSDLNHALCQKHYAEALIYGKHIEKNIEEGWKLILKAAINGDWDCECTLNEMDDNIMKKKSFNESWDYIKTLMFN